MDGSAYIYRGFFANRTLQRSDGFPTGALVVVSRILLRILRQERPRWFCFVKDGRGKNFRHDIYPQYKANREAMPEELSCQLEPIERMVHALGIHYEETEGFEADDGIASLAARFSKASRRHRFRRQGPQAVPWAQRGHVGSRLKEGKADHGRGL